MLPSLLSGISSRAPAISRNVCSRRIASLQSSRAVAAPSSSLSSSQSSSSPLSLHQATSMQLRPISYTPSTLAQITVDVPSMGDSITEGTIVEWCVPPGSHVREGDVLALVETDKVTVDIKADQEGVLVKQLGEVDGTVEVGDGLYILDTNLENASVAAAVAVESNGVSEVNASLDAEKMVLAEPASSSNPSARVPSIHFLGKEGWKKVLTATEDDSVVKSPTTIVPTSNNPNAPTSITTIDFSPMYGRPSISDDEMEALMLGGADEAPEVRSVVSEGLSGVVFVGGKVKTAGPRGVWLAE